MRIACFLALALFLNGCASQPAGSEAPETCRFPHALYVVRQAWHTGIVVKRGDLVAVLPALAADIGRDGYVEIGWGEERYYQAGTGEASLALRAALWPNASVLQVVTLADPPGSRTHAEVVELGVQEAGYRAALAYIAATFTRASDGGPVRLGPALAGPGWFYRAEGSFHLFNNCNKWAAGAIEASGFPVSSALTLTAGSLLGQLHADIERCQPERVSP